MKDQKGITLVALIITIIVMLILVSVVVTVVIQSNLLNTAKKAGSDTKNAYESERKMNSTINVNNQLINIAEINESTTF